MADSKNWTTREEAGFELRNLIEQDFNTYLELTVSWPKDESPRIRRAACLACMQRKATTTSTRLRRILKRLEPLMMDDDIYVRKCCGPFVVGYLGYTYPNITIPWLVRQARRKDLNVRANVAKAFSQALGGQRPLDAMKVLKLLADDERPRVRSAVAAALRNVVRRGNAVSSLPKSLRELLSRR
jgi:3-methyladenine DNA glycosylase AlkC